MYTTNTFQSASFGEHYQICAVLHYRNGHLDVIQYLVKEANCDPTVKDEAGETPLHKASM